MSRWVRQLQRMFYGSAIGAPAQVVISQLKEANRQNAQYVIIIGPDELLRGEVIMRSMATGQQMNIDLRKEMVDEIKEVLSRGL